MDTHDTLMQLCRNNADAVALIEGVWLVSQVYDDAIDGDKKMPEDQVHQAFAFALFGLNANPVYRAHNELRHVMAQSIACWRAANALEKSGEQEALHSAYVLRCSPYQFFVSVVLAVAGIDAAVEAAAFFYGRKTDDPLEAYMAEHTKAASAAQGA